MNDFVLPMPSMKIVYRQRFEIGLRLNKSLVRFEFSFFPLEVTGFHLLLENQFKRLGYLLLFAENTHLCTGSRDNTMRMWDIATGQCVLKNNISRNLVSLKLKPNLPQDGGKLVAIFAMKKLKHHRMFGRKN